MTSPAPTPMPTPPRAAATAASCGPAGWRSAPVSVTRPVAPAIAVITGVRAAAHPECGYDRVVFDITEPMPGYDIRYVTQVIADPSGQPIGLPGRSFLLITLHPAQAHYSSGAPAISRVVQTPGYPVLKSYVLAGDFEGVFTLALGLRGAASIRVGELPGRWFIDVRT
jgi:hypothetical protein